MSSANEMVTDMDDEKDDSIQATKAAARSIAYPFIALDEAVARALKLYENERKNAIPVESAVKHWNYAAKSSGGRQTIATLGYFGLIQNLGGEDGRQIKLTDRALDILLSPPESPDRKVALEKAAREPKLYAEILAKYPIDELPSDETLKYFLLRVKDINPNGVDLCLRNFRKTIQYAALVPSPDSPALTTDNSTVSQVAGDFRSPLPDSLFGASAAARSVAASTARGAGAPAYRQEVYSLEEGAATLQWPANASEESRQDLAEWLNLITKKLRVRRADLPPVAPSQ